MHRQTSHTSRSISVSAASPRITISSFRIFTSGICGKLVHRIGVIRTGLALADSLIFQTGRDGSTSIGGCDAFSIQITAQDNLPSVIYPVKVGIGWVLSSSGIVRIRIIVILPDFAVLTSWALIQGRAGLCTYIRISASSGTSFRAARYFTQRILIVGDIRQD